MTVFLMIIHEQEQETQEMAYMEHIIVVLAATGVRVAPMLEVIQIKITACPRNIRQTSGSPTGSTLVIEPKTQH